MKNDEDRRNAATSAADAIADVLGRHDIPIPKLLPAMVATPGHAIVPGVERDHDARMRVLRDHGWPERALRIAEYADRDRPAVCALERWKPDASAIVLSGSKGTGKTVAAAWWAIGARRSCRFVEAAEMVRIGRFNAERWDQWLNAPALCIDDLGAEYADAKDSFLADLDHLINRFYSSMRELIITTNCDAPAFAKRYGQRIASRLIECATWEFVGGGDQRENG